MIAVFVFGVLGVPVPDLVCMRPVTSRILNYSGVEKFLEWIRKSFVMWLMMVLSMTLSFIICIGP
jgi:hypothetical protein